MVVIFIEIILQNNRFVVPQGRNIYKSNADKMNHTNIKHHSL